MGIYDHFSSSYSMYAYVEDVKIMGKKKKPKYTLAVSIYHLKVHVFGKKN